MIPAAGPSSRPTAIPTSSPTRALDDVIVFNTTFFFTDVNIDAVALEDFYDKSSVAFIAFRDAFSAAIRMERWTFDIKNVTVVASGADRGGGRRLLQSLVDMVIVVDTEAPLYISPSEVYTAQQLYTLLKNRIKANTVSIRSGPSHLDRSLHAYVPTQIGVANPFAGAASVLSDVSSMSTSFAKQLFRQDSPRRNRVAHRPSTCRRPSPCP